MPAIRTLGQGYQPHVDDVDGALLYSLPVDSGFANQTFSFPIGREDLVVLRRDPYRRAVLGVLSHILLQPAVTGDCPAMDADAFAEMVQSVLHGTTAALHALVAEIGRDRNVHVPVFVEAALAAQSDPVEPPAAK